MAADHVWPHEAWKSDELWNENKRMALVPSLPTGSQNKPNDHLWSNSCLTNITEKLIVQHT